LLTVIIQYVFNAPYRTTQYFIEPIHSFLLYARGHTLIYYPSIHLCRRENPVNIFITQFKLKTNFYEQLSF